MEKIDKNDKIKSLKYGTFHVADEIEIIDGITVVYTEDSKCFPYNEIEKINEIEFYKNSFVSVLEESSKDNSNLLKIQVDESPEEYFNRSFNIQKNEENKKSNVKIYDFLGNIFTYSLVALVISGPIFVLFYFFKIINLIFP
jgi:hypothetical protein